MNTPEIHDVAVIGGGPAGSALAGLLASRGRRVAVIERDRFPRFHIGESLLPRSVEIFDKLGVRDRLEDRFLRKYGARFVCATTGRTNAYRFAEAFDPRYGYAYQVPRAEFDELLLRRAVELGADLREGWEATRLVRDGDRAAGVEVRHEGGPGIVRARIVVDAVGRETPLASGGVGRRRFPGLDTIAVFTHHEGVPRPTGDEEGDIHIIVFDHGWFWVIPFRGEVTSVGAVVQARLWRDRPAGESIEGFFDRLVAAAPPVAELLAGARRARPVGSVADFSYAVDAFAGPGWLAVGDACGFIDPLFSTGAHLAMKSADLAAAAIDDVLADREPEGPRFARYEREVRRGAELFLGVVQAFYRGEFRETLFAQDQRRALRQSITSLLSGDVFHAEPPPTWVRFLRERHAAEVPA